MFAKVRSSVLRFRKPRNVFFNPWTFRPVSLTSINYMPVLSVRVPIEGYSEYMSAHSKVVQMNRNCPLTLLSNRHRQHRRPPKATAWFTSRTIRQTASVSPSFTITSKITITRKHKERMTIIRSVLTLQNVNKLLVYDIEWTTSITRFQLTHGRRPDHQSHPAQSVYAVHRQMRDRVASRATSQRIG